MNEIWVQLEVTGEPVVHDFQKKEMELDDDDIHKSFITIFSFDHHNLTKGQKHAHELSFVVLTFDQNFKSFKHKLSHHFTMERIFFNNEIVS